MARKAVAVLAALGLLGAAGAQQGATRQEDLPDNMDVFRETPVTGEGPYLPEEEATGGAGEADRPEKGELVGEVAETDGARLWLRHAGALLPLRVTEDTCFSPSRGEVLQPGREVRARFIAGEDDYEVTSLQLVEPAPARRPPR